MRYRLSRMKSVVIASLIVLLLLFADIAVHNLSKSQPVDDIAYGVNVDMSAIIPGTPYTVRTANGGNFFDLAARLGINTLRITDVRWAVSGQEYPRSIWNTVFSDAARYHINIILLLVDGGHRTALQHAHTLLGEYGLAHFPSLWMVDLDNEPDVDDLQHMAEIREEAAYVHHIAPGVRVTIGGWKSPLPGHPAEFRYQDPDDIPKLIGIVDVVSVHLYQFDQGLQLGFTPQRWLQKDLDAVRQQARGKPILLEEFGAGNGLAPTTEPTPTGSPQWQAYVYSSVLQEISDERTQGVIGALAWIMTPRPARPDADSTDYEANMVGWAIVLNHGHRLLPAALTFSAVEHRNKAG